MYLVWTHWPVTNVIFGLPMTPNYGMSFKKTKWRTTHSEGVACLTPPSIGLIFAGRGQVISGRLDLEVDLYRTQNYFVQLSALYPRQMII